MSYRNEDGGLYKLFKENLKGALISKIETGATAPGFPDCIIVVIAVIVALEFKKWPPKLRPLQIAWFSKCHALGAPAFIVVRRKDEILFYSAGQARDLTTKTVPIASFQRPWDWKAILAVIVGAS